MLTGHFVLRFVQSDMGNAGARFFGLPQAFVPVKDAAKFMVSQVMCAASFTYEYC